jgi:hypothetical protein
VTAVFAREIVPEPVIVPPDNPVPAVIEVIPDTLDPSILNCPPMTETL